MSNAKQRMYDLSKDLQLINVATVSEDGKPRVRYVVGKADADLNLRFCTSLRSNKIRHMKRNPSVFVTLGAKDVMSTKNWLQIEGTAEISTAKAERDAFWFEALRAYFKGPDDPDYCVVIVKPSMIELWSMQSPTPEVWQPGK
jgi:general stress protein 26